jgi:hypothetical protein
MEDLFDSQGLGRRVNELLGRGLLFAPPVARLLLLFLVLGRRSGFLRFRAARFGFVGTFTPVGHSVPPSIDRNTDSNSVGVMRMSVSSPAIKAKGHPVSQAMNPLTEEK